LWACAFLCVYIHVTRPGVVPGGPNSLVTSPADQPGRLQCLMNVDGTDFPIFPPFPTRWSSSSHIFTAFPGPYGPMTSWCLMMFGSSFFPMKMGHFTSGWSSIFRHVPSPQSETPRLASHRWSLPALATRSFQCCDQVILIRSSGDGIPISFAGSSPSPPHLLPSEYFDDVVFLVSINYILLYPIGIIPINMLVIPYHVVPYGYILDLSDNRSLFRPLFHHPFRCEKKRQWGGALIRHFQTHSYFMVLVPKHPIISHEFSHELPIWSPCLRPKSLNLS